MFAMAQEGMSDFLLSLSQTKKKEDQRVHEAVDEIEKLKESEEQKHKENKIEKLKN